MGVGKTKFSKISPYIMLIGAAFIYAIGINSFIVPLGLYSGGFMGISQMIRTVLVDALGISAQKFDFAGVIYFLLNLPVLFIAFHSMGKRFLAKTIVCIVSQTIFLTLVQIPANPIIEDPLTSCIIGGLLSGVGTGIPLRIGASGGGTDTLGVFITKRYKNFSVGKLTLMVNACIYTICAILFELPIALYSIIYAAVVSTVVDRIHLQNISMMALICTKKEPHVVSDIVMKELHRGVTILNGQGAYTKEDTYVLLTAISKYEVHHLNRVIMETDPNAFIMYNDDITVRGNFEKRLS